MLSMPLRRGCRAASPLPHLDARSILGRFLSFFAVFLAGTPIPGTAQQAGWNDVRALELVERARQLRQRSRGDSTFQSYQADARGYVYFFLDREDDDEKVLVKTDQVALQVYWKAPDSTRQRIVGLRDQKQLPTTINYHLDHLTVVQDEFSDRIRLGDGDEVSAVPHPAAPGSGDVYDFRLADSITIRFAGPGGEIRVHEVEVRPKDFDAPGVIGRMFLSREDGAIVRMSFTFTPTSYVDDYLDYIRISLDNSLWEGEHWLPYEQSVELRRELPYLDFPAGTVIRGRYEIRNYLFNPDLPGWLFRGPRVTALPEDERRAFPFEASLHAQLDAEGLGNLAELDDIRAEATRIARRQALSGLESFRLWVPSASSALRYNRAEGLAVGAGWSFAPSEPVQLKIAAGYQVGRQRPTARADATVRFRSGSIDGRAYVNEVRDIGPIPASSGVLNTLAAVGFDTDYQDPYFATGARVGIRTPIGRPWTVDLGVIIERHRSAVNVVDDSVEPTTEAYATGSALARGVRSIVEGTLYSVDLDVGRSLGGGVDAMLTGRAGRIAASNFLSTTGTIRFSREWLTRGVQAEAELTGGIVSRDAPLQSLALVGGRGTLPGHGYRRWAGDRYAVVRTHLSRSVWSPWIRVGAFATLASTTLGADRQVPTAWDVAATPGSRSSVGITLELMFDLIRVDAGRGLDGGHWDVFFDVRRSFRRWL
jgi:hypothetical protein